MAAPRNLKAAWAHRSPVHSRRAWAFLLALDRLPWPYGEEIMAGCSVLTALVKISRLRQALAWAAAHRSTRPARWRLAVGLCSTFGRIVARSAFTGIRDLETLRPLVRLRGEEHLAAAGRAVVLLGFHLGPMSPDVALRIAGYRVTWIARRGVWRGGGAAWPQEIRRLYESSTAGDSATPATPSMQSVRALYLAHGILRSGENVYITADGAGDAVAFEVPLPGGSMRVRHGWLLLRELTDAPVLPVLSHMEGRTLVATIYPALPAPLTDPGRDLDACREALGRLLGDYVRRAPEQCYSLVFGMGRAGYRGDEATERPANGSAETSRG